MGTKMLAARIAALTGSGVDYVLEITGSPKMHKLALEVLKPQGTVALIANPSAATAFAQGRRTMPIIQGDAVPQAFIPKMIALYEAGQFPFDRLVKFYDFHEINRAIAEAQQGDTIKPVLRFPPA